MKYDAIADKSPQKHTEFLEYLSAQTVDALKNAQGNSAALREAIKQYLFQAAEANLDPEEIEDVLGVSKPCILDAADLSEDDEEIVVTAFEQLTEL